MTIDTRNNGATAVLPPPDEIQKASQNQIPSADDRDDASLAQEEASESEIPGDPRPPHALQPPTAEEY